MSKSSNFLRGLARILWLCFIAGLILAAAIFAFVSKTKMPNTEELENPNFEYASIVYDENIEEIGRYYKYNRESVDFEALNPHLVNALIATEDERYRRHSGIDARGTARAVFYLGKKGGASTITQQLAKLFFTEKASSTIKRIWQKLSEWAIAVQFEKRYTKEEIIAMYLNKFDYINGAHGIQAASQTYFSKNQKDLSVSEAALLIGMLKNPSRYNPRRFIDQATHRRNVVLGQMVKNGYLDQVDFDKLKVDKVDISNFKRDVHYEGPAPYFRSTLTTYLKNLLAEDKYRKPDGTKYDIYRDGIKVYTTLNLEMQKHAEAAAKKTMNIVQNRYFDLWEGKDPWTYEAEEEIKKIRTESLSKQVRESERFLNLRQKYLSEVNRNILKDFPKARLWDADIFRMFKAEKDDNHLRTLLSKNVIRRDQAEIYRQILDSEYWPVLKERWNALNRQAKVVLNKETKMTVFDYGSNGEKTVTMTPLDSIRYHRMHMQIGSVSMDPKTGYIKTWVGGINNKYFKYDHVTSNRQVGSTFKPFLYATAMFQQSMSPCQPVRDIQYTIPAGDPNFGLMDPWSPSNARGTFSKENITLKEGLKKSLNSVSIWLMMQLGTPAPVRELASNMGIDKSKIPNVPSIALGSAELNVFEMTAAYGVYANNGVYNKPIFVTRIEDNNGQIIYNAIPERKKVLPENYNYAMVELLKYAASPIDWALETEFGGKTGTTNDYVDGWFMGITPNLVTGTWVGGEDPWIRFLTIEQGQGGVMARPFFVDYMQRVENDPSLEFDKMATFIVPDGDLIESNCDVYNVTQKSEKDTVARFEKVLEKEFEEEFDEEF